MQKYYIFQRRKMFALKKCHFRKITSVCFWHFRKDIAFSAPQYPLFE